MIQNWTQRTLIILLGSILNLVRSQIALAGKTQNKNEATNLLLYLTFTPESYYC